MNIKEALQIGTRHLSERRLRSPRLDAELLLSTVLRRDRGFLYSYPDRMLSEEERHLFRVWLERRGEHYPLQYLLGLQEFYGRKFWAYPGVFIPRPETEVVVETALEFLGGLPDPQLIAADIGTGSGCIGITLACQEPRLELVATDVSPLALKAARQNAAMHGCIRRIRFCLGSLLMGVNSENAYHVVLSNPPYVGTRARGAVDLSVDKYEPHEAVYAGESGHEMYLKLFAEVGICLRPGGRLILEIGDGLEELARWAEGLGWDLVEIRRDLAGLDRCAVWRVKASGK